MLGIAGGVAAVVVAGLVFLLTRSGPEPSIDAPSSTAPSSPTQAVDVELPAAAPPTDAVPPDVTPPPAVAATAPASVPASPAPVPAAAAKIVTPPPAAPATAGAGSAVPPRTDTPARAAGPAKPDAGAEELRVARAKYDHALYDQAITDLKVIVDRVPPSSSAPAAHLLMANAYERLNRPDDAAAAYIELRTKYPASPSAAEGTFAMAELTLRSKRPDRERELGARELFTEITSSYPDSPLAPRALVRRAALEDQANVRVVDAQLKTSVPAALVSYRTLVERYPDAEWVEASLVKLADMYEDLRRYELAAQALDDLVTRFPTTTTDAAWRAGELWERRVKNMDAARSAYARVPASSSRYKEAQKRALQR
jgi:TolA-binding protein